MLWEFYQDSSSVVLLSAHLFYLPESSIVLCSTTIFTTLFHHPQLELSGSEELQRMGKSSCQWIPVCCRAKCMVCSVRDVGCVYISLWGHGLLLIIVATSQSWNVDCGIVGVFVTSPGFYQWGSSAPDITSSLPIIVRLFVRSLGFQLLGRGNALRTLLRFVMGPLSQPHFSSPQLCCSPIMLSRQHEEATVKSSHFHRTPYWMRCSHTICENSNILTILFSYNNKLSITTNNFNSGLIDIVYWILVWAIH